MPRAESRPLILWTLSMAVLTVILAWALLQVRQALLLIYVSGLLAVGFSPLVRLIERRTLLPMGGRIPRWLAILVVYLAILAVFAAIALAVLPPLLHQAREFWDHAPRLFGRAQSFLIARGIITERVTVGELVQQAPATPTDMVGTVALTLWGLFGGMLGVITILVLTFYLLVEADTLFSGFLRLSPRPGGPASARPPRR